MTINIQSNNTNLAHFNGYKSFYNLLKITCIDQSKRRIAKDFALLKNGQRKDKSYFRPVNKFSCFCVIYEKGYCRQVILFANK